jgi:diguanylate cyclase (GGDEF)-like protein
MAAIDHHSRTGSIGSDGPTYLAAAQLSARLDEEVHRAERHGTPLSCLLLVIDNMQEIAREHDSDLPEQTLDYVGGALARELRDFDRIGRPSDHELMIVLPGADEPSGEIVARRVLERLHTIKVEAQGQRRPLRVSLGLASWRKDACSVDLLERTRAATRGRNGGGPLQAGAQGGPSPHWQAGRTEAQAAALDRPAGGRFTRQSH